jgi:hypothetical protein
MLVTKDFMRVEVNDTLNSCTDGMPKVREASDNECLMSWLDDECAEIFEMLNTPFHFTISDELTTTEGVVFRNTMEHETFLIFDTAREKVEFIKWWNNSTSFCTK